MDWGTRKKSFVTVCGRHPWVSEEPQSSLSASSTAKRLNPLCFSLFFEGVHLRKER